MRLPVEKVRRLLVVAALSVAAFVAVTGYASHARPAQAAALGPASQAGRTVTLVSGDVVSLGPDGTVQLGAAAGLAPRPAGRHVSYATYVRDGDRYVVPADAGPLIQAGLLDQRLFDVTDLLRQGYGDGSSAVVPLLVHGGGGLRGPLPLAGARVRSTLPDLELTALDVPKSQAVAFWDSLRGQADLAKRAPGGGIVKIWLNARYHAALDRSVAQVGAPAAWRAGYTGAGATVAVLDSGVDANHPDLAGRITAAEDFTGTGSVVDRLGHGTHVASIVGGSGAASGGLRRGVAPGARLAIGKVLGDDGFGDEAAILAGMQWAVADAGAKVVNLSLGGPPSDGSDPLDQAVDQLSARYGALFVVAAGNRGPSVRVSSPASADAALAVASVDRSDALSPFSSGGPRIGDGAAKPEIAAPGDGIMAARAAGAFPDIAGEQDYVALSGTSMAAPHVAGAAAILAQQHPDWTGAQLKAALVNSAAPARGATAFGVGAGRLDVARAVGQRVVAGSASLSLDLPWSARPQPGQLIQTYRNDTTTPVTLHLALRLTDRTGHPAPAGLAVLDSSILPVPAHGTATVRVRTNRASSPGSYDGVLVATGRGTSLRTPVAVQQEPQRHRLTVKGIDRNGGGVSSEPNIVQLDSADPVVAFGDEPLSLPAGRYAIGGQIVTERAGADPLFSVVGYPVVRLDRDRTVTLDARWTHPAPVTVQDRLAADAGQRTVTLSLGSIQYFAYFDSGFFGRIYAGSAPGVSDPAFTYSNTASLERPELQLSATRPQRFPVNARWLQTDPRPPFVGAADLDAVPVAVGETDQLPDLAGKLAVLESDGKVDLAGAVDAVAAAGARMVVAPPQFSWDGSPLALPTIETAEDSVATGRFLDLARSGGLTATVTGLPISPFRYLLGFSSRGSVPPEPGYQVRTGQLAAVPTSYHGAVDAWRDTFPSVLLAGKYVGTPFGGPVPAPIQRVEYYTPGAWHMSVYTDQSVTPARVDLSHLRVGTNAPLVWDEAVVGPRLLGSHLAGTEPFAGRHDNLISVQLPLFTDGAGHTGRTFDPSAVVGTTSLYRDGRLVGTVSQPGAGQFTVPAAASRYQLIAHASVDSPSWPLSSDVSAQWTFRSTRVSGQASLPLIAVGLSTPTSLRNSVPAGAAVPLTVSVERQDGVAGRPVTALTLQASSDDGASWRPLTVERRGRSWRAIMPGVSSGYVSLRAAATDSAGNTVDETILRAYQIDA